MVTVTSHEHPFTLVKRKIKFICDFCGIDGGRNPYICTTCDLMVHKGCISSTLPHTIKITRHHHHLSHHYYLQKSQSNAWECRICLNLDHGSYSCSVFDCNYIAHVRCATDTSIWGGTPWVEDKDEALQESINLITVLKKISVREDVLATEIKHAYHEHDLILTFSGEVQDVNNCDGCMRPISAPYNSCEQGEFFLHMSCTELPIQKQHLSHTHLLTLIKDELVSRGDTYDHLPCGLRLNPYLDT
ncbi:uncharacterized protein LOC110414789 [Herrania umbratica]|uniref:Uncharacterized protein LOC110414789 n=1 Tax=Herrania umbratica TaxID=108875 RepID=A0A6J1A411_9ROSI|nr:uncharacterized protein LOC110414789 [Herrania umbratica]